VNGEENAGRNITPRVCISGGWAGEWVREISRVGGDVTQIERAQFNASLVRTDVRTYAPMDARKEPFFGGGVKQIE